MKAPSVHISKPLWLRHVPWTPPIESAVMSIQPLEDPACAPSSKVSTRSPSRIGPAVLKAAAILAEPLAEELFGDPGLEMAAAEIAANSLVVMLAVTE
jgi:hypothetical protein